MESYLALIIAVTIYTLKPGPVTLSMISRTVEHGRYAMISFILGNAVGVTLLLILTFLGLLYIVPDIEFFFFLLKAFAAVYLIYLGISTLISPAISYKQVDREEHDGVKTFTAAILLVISNPLDLLFYIGFIPAFVEAQTLTLKDAGVILCIVLIIETLIALLYCVPVLITRSRLPEKFFVKLRVASAVLIIFIGLYIGYTALPAADITSLF